MQHLLDTIKNLVHTIGAMRMHSIHFVLMWKESSDLHLEKITLIAWRTKMLLAFGGYCRMPREEAIQLQSNTNSASNLVMLYTDLAMLS